MAEHKTFHILEALEASPARTWRICSRATKARTLAEGNAAAAYVSAVARAHGASAPRVFRWRRDPRKLRVRQPELIRIYRRCPSPSRLPALHPRSSSISWGTSETWASEHISRGLAERLFVGPAVKLREAYPAAKIRRPAGTDRGV